MRSEYWSHMNGFLTVSITGKGSTEMAYGAQVDLYGYYQ